MLEIIIKGSTAKGYTPSPVHKYVDPPNLPTVEELCISLEKIEGYFKSSGTQINEATNPFPYIGEGILTSGAHTVFYEIDGLKIIAAILPYGMMSLNSDYSHRATIIIVGPSDKDKLIKEKLKYIKDISGISNWKDMKEEKVKPRSKSISANITKYLNP